MTEIGKILKKMEAHGMRIPDEVVNIQIEGAVGILKEVLGGLLQLRGESAVWLPEYADVASWLEGNNGKGLFMYGNCGRGKTLLARYVLPAILLEYAGRVVSCYDSQEMNEKIDAVLKKKIICIDDVGTEDTLSVYGNKRVPFYEVVDAAEKESKLLIATSNLNSEQLLNKYGERTMERIVATTKRVVFEGGSLRK